MNIDSPVVRDIRVSSRLMVRELGFMANTLAATDYSPSAVHTLLETEAHLRWFILDDGCRGHGIGRRLLAEAMRFCDEKGFHTVHLWTFNKLTAARRLYESFGFRLEKEWRGDQWGNRIIEQQFTRRNASEI